MEGDRADDARGEADAGLPGPIIKQYSRKRRQDGAQSTSPMPMPMPMPVEAKKTAGIHTCR